MGSEQRCSNRYYDRKEREGLRVKSTYVGHGEIAHLISHKQESSCLSNEAIRMACAAAEALSDR